ncbi:hypothetical protein VCRA2126O85_140103 [Vibrio crassostreae]|nr:hypothetical protein VCRA2126O86_130103 [Vibrio crassostreae]CAK2629161.1 hypothetical protein VCRA2125O83_140016 [Vibrio crassostreae]CAK2636922.1 hypothetical protein VCRA2127O91_140104 [Vibrio crassostreae]CAK2637506.1 hypothetical protein VCRA2128O106_140103 [Vibrio crassostreae]CAK2637656.1 hypothetical protein VCRA2126O85_140103 [Vibrio crassostreae]
MDVFGLLYVVFLSIELTILTRVLSKISSNRPKRSPLVEQLYVSGLENRFIIEDWGGGGRAKSFTQNESDISKNLIRGD